MSTHNICFGGEIRKILCGYPLLSVAMDTHSYLDLCHGYNVVPTTLELSQLDDDSELLTLPPRRGLCSKLTFL